MTKHSEAYDNFIKQVNVQGYQKAQGYDPNLFNKIHDFERDEVEKILLSFVTREIGKE